MYSNAFITAKNALFYNNVDIANIGDAAGLVGSAAPGDFYWQAHELFPGRAGNQTSSEASYTGYLRVASTRSGTTQFTLSGNEVVTASAVPFPKQTDAGTDILAFWSLGIAAAGTGMIIRMGTFGGGPLKVFSAATDDLLTTYEAHGLSANDRVVLYEIVDDTAFPVGLTEGTVYHVIATGLTATAFSVSATQGGAAVDVTTAGIGRWQKCEPVQMGLNVAPTIEAGARFITA